MARVRYSRTAMGSRPTYGPRLRQVGVSANTSTDELARRSTAGGWSSRRKPRAGRSLPRCRQLGSSCIDGSKTRFAPNLAPLTYATYESHVKNYIEPGIGALRLDRLRVADVQPWLNRLASQCQWCAQGKDARRALHGTARCCAIGKCCHRVASPRTIKDVRTVLRSALDSAVRQELIDRMSLSSYRFLGNASGSWCPERARRLGDFSNSHARTPIRSTPHTCWCWFLVFARARFSASLGRQSTSSAAHLSRTISCSESVGPSSTAKRRPRHPMLGCLCPRLSLQHLSRTISCSE